MAQRFLMLKTFNDTAQYIAVMLCSTSDKTSLLVLYIIIDSLDKP